MSKYRWYRFTKELYNDYLVLIRYKDKLVTYDYDLEIYKLFKLDNINYLIIDGLDIKLYSNVDNKYNYYYKIIILKEVMNYIMKVLNRYCFLPVIRKKNNWII